MKIMVEVPDDCYGDYLDEDDNLVVQEPPVGDRAKREKLLDRSLTNGNVSDLRWLP